MPVRRRTVLASTATTAAVGVAAPALGESAVAAGQARSTATSYFQHGVASGDPLPDSVLLWTRLTPTPASTPGSGKGPRATVSWEVATDQAFRRVVKQGAFVTSASRDHTIKVSVEGLRPASWYFYRFTYRGQRSRIGRTRTAPAADAIVDNLRLGVTSCANWQAGYFSAYRGLAERTDLHAIVHLGDYIYEYGPGEYGYGPQNEDIRPHVPAHEILTLADYRQRHAQYKTDPDLQRLHAAYPWIVTWDDHETADNAYKDGAANHDSATEGDYLKRRAQAHRAYDEWMPARLNGTAKLEDGDRLYRRFRFGNLAELSMLDLRSYRDQQVDWPGASDPGEVSDPDRTITGTEQMDWLLTSLASKKVQWKIIGNPVMIAPLDLGALPQAVIAPVHDALGVGPTDGVPINTDQWDGYTADRRKVFDQLATDKTVDTVFITGDIHSAWVNDLPADAATFEVTPDSLGVEFVCTSVTSNTIPETIGAPDGFSGPVLGNLIQTTNPHIKHVDLDHHGYCVLDVTPGRTQCDWYTIADRAAQKSPATWAFSYQTLAGSNRVSQVGVPVN